MLGLVLKKTMRIASFAALPLLLVACAGDRSPDDALARAELALRHAENSQAPREAPVEMQTARDKYARAQRAAGEENYDEARRLADEAAADAEKAEASAQAAIAAQNKQEVDQTLDALGQPLATVIPGDAVPGTLAPGSAVPGAVAPSPVPGALGRTAPYGSTVPHGSTVPPASTAPSPYGTTTSPPAGVGLPPAGRTTY